MPSRFRSRMAERARRILGTAELAERIATLEERIDQPPSPGPVYFGDNTVLVATRWGGRMIVDTRDMAMAPWLALDGLWEPQVTGWLRSVLHPGDVFVDVGANIGYFTLLGASLVGSGGLVVAVEAHPRLAGILQRNVVMNGYHGFVDVRAVAAWSERTELEFHTRTNFTSSSSLGTIDPAGLISLGDTTETVRVEATTLDHILASRARVDVIKIDVEGAEAHVLTGLARTLEANPKAMVIFEWGRALIDAVGDRPEDLVELVKGYGFHLTLVETGSAVEADQLLDLPYGNVLARR